MALSLKDKDTEVEQNTKTDYFINPNQYKPDIQPDLDKDFSLKNDSVNDDLKSKSSGLSIELIDKITFISGIVIYVVYALYVLYVVKIAMGGPGSIAEVAKSLSIVATILAFFTIADAVFIFIFVEKNIILLISAIFFSALYPYLRGRFLNGKNDIIGAALVLVFVLSLVFLTINSAKSSMKYGSLSSISDESVRTESMNLMDSELAPGLTYSKAMIEKGYFVPQNAELKKENGKNYIILSGNGYIGNFQEYGADKLSAPVNTAVKFEKTNSGYDIVGLSINGEAQNSDIVYQYISFLKS